MTTPHGRRLAIVFLVATFFIQTALVYLDDSGYQTPRLSKQAIEGRNLWLKNNCQSCHQIYGFGGFLGPDLTNAVQHLAAERLLSILKEGQSPMPAFHFSDPQIKSIAAFLTEMDATGTGQFRFAKTIPGSQILAQFVEKTIDERPLTDPAKAGLLLLQDRKCIGCHLPNLQSTKRAPNLCDLISKPGSDGIIQTLQLGRAARGMPQFDLTTDELDSLLAILQWMHEQKADIENEFETIANQNADAARIPWFEYER